jgi:hypothetical protein
VLAVGTNVPSLPHGLKMVCTHSLGVFHAILSNTLHQNYQAKKIFISEVVMLDYFSVFVIYSIAEHSDCGKY